MLGDGHPLGVMLSGGGALSMRIVEAVPSRSRLPTDPEADPDPQGPTAGDPDPFTHPLPPHSHESAAHLRREALTMGLYVSITLLAALTAATGEASAKRDVLAIVWGTTVGLALAHWLAFSMAVRLVHPTSDNRDLNQQLLVQLGAAATVAIVATVPVLVLPVHLGRPGARFATAATIGVVTYAEARSFGQSRTRALRLAAIALLLGLLVAGVKYGLGH